MSRPALPRGLYAITEAQPQSTERLLAGVRAAIAGGAVTVQYRDKSADHVRRVRATRALVELCAAAGVVLIVNDDVALAAANGAHGVHLGEEDCPVAQARGILGPRPLIGVSCYDSLARARRAQEEGADYVAFGSFFPSPTKPAARRATLALLTEARAALALPFVAIGGITPENGGALVAAGARALAVSSGLFAQPDPRSAARRYAALFEESLRSHRA